MIVTARFFGSIGSMRLQAGIEKHAFKAAKGYCTRKTIVHPKDGLAHQAIIGVLLVSLTLPSHTYAGNKQAALINPSSSPNPMNGQISTTARFFTSCHDLNLPLLLSCYWS